MVQKDVFGWKKHHFVNVFLEILPGFRQLPKRGSWYIFGR